MEYPYGVSTGKVFDLGGDELVYSGNGHPDDDILPLQH